MKICVIGTRGFPFIQGGVEKHCECLYKLFPDSDKIIVFRRKPYVSKTPQYPQIKFIDLPSTQIKGFEAAFHSLLATLYTLALHPDIAHIHNIGNALYTPILRLFGIKVILTYHSPNYEHAKWGKIAKQILKYSELIALQSSNAVIFVNKFQMMKYSKRVSKKSIYIPNGIDRSSTVISNDILKKFSLEPQNYILGVGRITPEKGFDCLIKAFNAIENKNIKLVIAGGVETESKYCEELKSLCQFPEKTIFTGALCAEKLAQLYNNASLFVLSSFNEGFPIVLLEAMSHGCNILVSDIPACKLLNFNKSNYFRCGDSQHLTKQINSAITQGPVKSDYDLSEYDWHKIAQKTIHFFKSTTKQLKSTDHINTF